jgi:hypothetical protein
MMTSRAERSRVAVRKDVMITPRGLITLLLLAVLVSIVLSGVANWRGAAQPRRAPAAAAPPVRAQLGRSAHAWSLGVGQTVGAAREPSRADQASPATASERRLDPYAADLGAVPVSERATMIARKTDTPGPTRSREAAPFSYVPTRAAAAATPGAASGAASGPLAIVEFVGVTQDEQLLQQGEFSAALVRELKIIVKWNIAGSYTQRLELFTPNGALYKQFTTAFDGDAGRVQGRTAVETGLPVGGTWMTEYSLYGAWRVDVYLSGQPKPVTSASFLLDS